MELALDIAWVLLGGLVLYLGAEWLVKGAAGLARIFGLPELVIGLTVVAYGTSTPELAVSISAALSGNAPVVLGNVIGSNIANLGFILGLTALIAPPKVEENLIRREIPILLFSSFCLPLLMFGDTINRIESLGLVVLAVAFTFFTFRASRTDGQVPARLEAQTDGQGPASRKAEKDTPRSDEGVLRLLLITLLGLVFLVGGGELFLRGATGIARELGMSDRLVGLTIVAFGTSLPELAASVVAALRGHSALAIGNVVGSNIFNVFLVLGVSGAIRPMAASMTELRLDLLFIVGITLLGALFMRSHRYISRLEGGVLMTTYAAFIVLATLGF